MADDRREGPLASASSDEEQLPTDPSGFALDTDSDDDPEAGGWTSFSQLEQELRDSLEQTISANHNTNELVSELEHLAHTTHAEGGWSVSEPEPAAEASQRPQRQPEDGKRGADVRKTRTAGREAEHAHGRVEEASRPQPEPEPEPAQSGGHLAQPESVSRVERLLGRHQATELASMIRQEVLRREVDQAASRSHSPRHSQALRRRASPRSSAASAADLVARSEADAAQAVTRATAALQLHVELAASFAAVAASADAGGRQLVDLLHHQFQQLEAVNAGTGRLHGARSPSHSPSHRSSHGSQRVPSAITRSAAQSHSSGSVAARPRQFRTDAAAFGGHVGSPRGNPASVPRGSYGQQPRGRSAASPSRAPRRSPNRSSSPVHSRGNRPGPLHTDTHTPSAIIGDGTPLVHEHMFGDDASGFAWASSLRSAGSRSATNGRGRGSRSSPRRPRSSSSTASSHARAKPTAASSRRSPVPEDMGAVAAAAHWVSTRDYPPPRSHRDARSRSPGGTAGSSPSPSPSAIIGDGTLQVHARAFGRDASGFAWASSLRSGGRARDSRGDPGRARSYDSLRQSEAPRFDGEATAGSAWAGQRPVSLPDGWTAHTSDSGEEFYHNAMTRQSQWQWPTDERLPSGWEAAVSRSTGAIYYHDTATGHTQYERPAQYYGAASPAASPSINASTKTTRTGPRRRELRPTHSHPSAASPALL